MTHTDNAWAPAEVVRNDAFLRSTFRALVAESEKAPPENRLVMYDACDDKEIKAPLGVFRKRLDSRRNAKPKKPDTQKLVCTPFDPDAFNFSKISNPRERLLTLNPGEQSCEGEQSYDLLTNKFPLFANHMLLTAKALVPQQMTRAHLAAISELLQGCSFCAYFNSWCASASVNHFHCHLIDESPPVTAFPLVTGPIVNGVRCLRPLGFPGQCYVFPSGQIERVNDVVLAMQACNQPHNMLFTRRHVYVFPKPLVRPARSFELYPESVGGPELIGSFTVYTEADYDLLSEAALEELMRLNTAQLPAWVLLHDAAPTASQQLVKLAAPRPRHALKRPRSAMGLGSSGELSGGDALPALPLGLALQRSVSFELVSF